MLSVAPPDASELRSNATFEALLWAMSRPGDVRALPEPGFGGIIEALIDLECTAFSDDAVLGRQLAATGATITANLAEAGYVFMQDLEDFERRLDGLDCGSAFYPDDAATLVSSARFGSGTHLRLFGPGIETYRDIMLDIPPGFWAWRARLRAYPEGFDLVLTDGAALLAIPRSTQVEVL